MHARGLVKKLRGVPASRATAADVWDKSGRGWVIPHRIIVSGAALLVLGLSATRRSRRCGRLEMR